MKVKIWILIKAGYRIEFINMAKTFGLIVNR